MDSIEVRDWDEFVLRRKPMDIPDWVQHPSKPEYIVDANTGNEVFRAQNVKDAQMLMRVLKYLRDADNPPKSEQEYWKGVTCIAPNRFWDEPGNR